MLYKARIKFDNREWIVVDNIEYNGVKYYYIIQDVSEELEQLGNIKDYKGNLTLEFIYKLENGNYKNVTNEELLENLLNEVAIKNID